MAWKIVAVLSAVCLFFAAIAGITRVAWHEDNEIVVVERATIADLTRRSPDVQRVELARAHLVVDQQATFELCADDPMHADRWTDTISLSVRPLSEEEGLTFLLDASILANVARSDDQGCLIVGNGPILAEDDYAIEASWERRPDAIADVLLQTRILALRRVDDLDLYVVVFGWLGAMLCAIAFALRRRADPAPVTAEADRPSLEWERANAPKIKLPNEARAAIGVVVFVVVFVGSGALPPGAALSLGASLLIALGECGIALGLAPSPRLETLALHAPPKYALIFFPIAILSGVLLWATALFSMSIVPSTGQAPIQALVSWPSGLVSFAALAVVAPLAEEIFFRGFVYGTLEKRSRILAFALAWLSFTLLHASQTWGQWGALVAILLTGLGLTSLRAVSKSTVVPAIAHLIYNGILAIGEVIARA
jgi:membrane protease YdiL (CAAX protease family)